MPEPKTMTKNAKSNAIGGSTAAGGSIGTVIIFFWNMNNPDNPMDAVTGGAIATALATVFGFIGRFLPTER